MAGTALQWWSEVPSVASEAGPANAGDAVLVDLHGTADAWPGRTWRIVDQAGTPLLHAFQALDACRRAPYLASIHLIERQDDSPTWQVLAEAHLSSAVGYRRLLQAIGRAAVLLLRSAARMQDGPCHEWEPGPALPSRRLPLFRATLASAVAWVVARVGGDTYGIAVLDRPPAGFLHDTTMTVDDWIRLPEAKGFIADPFFWPGRPDVMLCETYSHRSGLGRLIAFQIGAEPGLSVEAELLAVPHHLSYPCSWTHDGRIYCLPEMAGGRRQVLYELKQGEPLIPVCVVAENVEMADPTVMEAGGYLWLSYTDMNIGGYDNLCLMFARSPEGPWQPHPANPVKIDVRSSRPGGTPFRVDGRLYRPAQDCARTYGAAVVVNEVMTCTPFEYRERSVARLLPDPMGDYPDGLHTLSFADGRAAIDGKRISFHPIITIHKLRRHALKLFSHRKSRRPIINRPE